MKMIPHEMQKLAHDFGIDERDVFTIHLNLCGLSNSNLANRVRMFLKWPRAAEKYFLILSTNRSESPYEIRDGEIRFNGSPVLSVSDVRPDVALTGYRRHAGKALTLNTNFRTGCTGCIFCPNTSAPSISHASQPALNLKAELELMDTAMGHLEWAEIEDIVISTGCFRSANDAINHMEQIQDWAHNKGFEGSLGILSSELIKPSHFESLRARILKPRIIFTLECFDKREILLRESKARVTPNEILNATKYAFEAGIDTGLTYLLGLDPLEVVSKELPRFFPYLTTFPNIQVYQAHNAVMEATRHPMSLDISYYLEARRVLGAELAAVGLEPEPWRNYRSPWLFEFQGRTLSSSAR